MHIFLESMFIIVCSVCTLLEHWPDGYTVLSTAISKLFSAFIIYWAGSSSSNTSVDNCWDDILFATFSYILHTFSLFNKTNKINIDGQYFKFFLWLNFITWWPKNEHAKDTKEFLKKKITNSPYFKENFLKWPFFDISWFPIIFYLAKSG
jgi:hypothetical protein